MFRNKVRAPELEEFTMTRTAKFRSLAKAVLSKLAIFPSFAKAVLFKLAIFPSLVKEGWPRHPENAPVPFIGADGVVGSTSNHPVCVRLRKLRTILLMDAATPPYHGGELLKPCYFLKALVIAFLCAASLTL